MKKLTSADILYEDNHLIAVNKPAGMLVQGDETGDRPLNELVKDYIAKKYNKPGAVYLGTVHRLDRPVSGLVLFARTSKSLTRMNKLFSERKVTKIYFALIDQKPRELSGHLVHWLTKDKERNVARAHQKEIKGSKHSVLDYQYIATANHKFLLRIQPYTGRPHQIRVQLARIGYPISGDLKYGSAKGRDNMIYLHSYSLEFVHPVKKERLSLHCPFPEEVNWNFFREYCT